MCPCARLLRPPLPPSQPRLANWRPPRPCGQTHRALNPSLALTASGLVHRSSSRGATSAPSGA
eukprot:15434187-Alexandrium_andersonii.AAC.1